MQLEKLTKEYWQKMLPPPMSPSDGDVEIFKSNIIEGTTLLLGCTHSLLNLSTKQMDIDPWYESPTVIVEDWRNNKEKYTNIIGCGVLNFNKELSDKVIEMCSKCSRKTIIRSFAKKFPIMKIADYFPTEKELIIQPNFFYNFGDYNFFIWNFN
jgi:hypothetical protein